MDIFLIERREVFVLFSELLYTGEKQAGKTPSADPRTESLIV